ncbi:hypothetical protein GCM10022209_44280 [Chitinophaga oryziterrae]
MKEVVINGYGWDIYEMPLGNTAERIETIAHGGGIDGFNTQLTRMPSDKSFIEKRSSRCT